MILPRNKRLDVRACLEAMIRHDGLTGIAFVAHVAGKGWISDACGVALERPQEAQEQLPALDAKLSRLGRSRRA